MDTGIGLVCLLSYSSKGLIQERKIYNPWFRIAERSTLFVKILKMPTFLGIVNMGFHLHVWKRPVAPVYGF